MPRTLAEVYRRFGEAEAQASPLQGRIALALSESDDALKAIATLPARKRQPALVLAALHDVALAGRAPALAEAFRAADAEAAAHAALDTLLQMSDAIAALVVNRNVQDDEWGRHAVLYPAIAEAAHQLGARSIGLIDVGRPAGLNLNVDRVAVHYSDGKSLGVSGSSVQRSAKVVRGHCPPSRPLPEVVARILVDLTALDVTAEPDARWLRACLRPDHLEERHRLEAEIALAAAPPRLFRADAAEMLSDAIAHVPHDALPVVTTTWALSKFSLERRLKFLHRLDEVAAQRPVAWVSAEGVGVAPAIPTLGDRRASGHSIIGMALLDRAIFRAYAIGRCWSQGSLLAWLA